MQMMEIKEVLSAKRFTLQRRLLGKSFEKIRNSSGPRIE